MKDSTMMKIAAIIASNESKCVAHQVGTVLVKNNRIVSTGYNGTPSGQPNCNEVNASLIDETGNFCNDDMKHKHHEWSLIHELHAEHNAIMYSTPHDREGSTLYCTLQPCYHCSILIAGSGIKRVVYAKPYHRAAPESLAVLERAGIVVEQYKGN